MVSIVAGQGLGLHNTSLGILGGQGQWGVGSYGQAGEQVLVNAATGNLVVQQQDEWLVGVGPDAVIGRTYNSQGVGLDDNADNWQSGLSRRIVSFTGSVGAASSKVTRLGEDGLLEVYEWSVDQQAYVSHAGAGSFDTLNYANGLWTWIDGDSRVQEFYQGTQSSARLTEVRDAQGHKLLIKYEEAGNINLISRIESWAAGDSTAREWVVIGYQVGAGKTNNIASLTTHYRSGASVVASKRVSYEYDGYNRLSMVTVDLTPEDSAVDGKIYQTRYTYDDAVAVGTARLKTLEFISEGSARLEFSYQDIGGEFRIQQIQHYEGSTLKQQTSLDYSVAGKTRITDAMGQVTEIEYETSVGQNQNQVKKVSGPAVNGVSQVQNFVYDGQGNVKSVKDARGWETVYEYDNRGNRIYQRDAHQNVIRWSYDDSNRLIKQSTYRDVDPDGWGEGQPTQAQVTRYVYDGLDPRVRFSITPEGRVTEYLYNDAQGLKSQIQYAAQFYISGEVVPSLVAMQAWSAATDKISWERVDYFYDFRGQLDRQVKYTEVDGTGEGVLGGSSSTIYVYDYAGNLIYKAEEGELVLYQYDGLNRVALSTDALGRDTVTEYIDGQRQTKVTLHSGLVRTSVYDAMGRLLSISQGTAGDQAALGITNYTYDKMGRLTRATLPDGQTSYTLYDEAGRIAAEIDAEGGMVEYLYNEENQVQQRKRYATPVTVSNLALVNSSLAAQQNVAVSSIRPPSLNNSDRREVYLYDFAGRLRYTITAAATPLGLSAATVVERRYDGVGRLVAEVAYASQLNSTDFEQIVSSLREPLVDDGLIMVRLSSGAYRIISIATDAQQDRVNQNIYDADGLLIGRLDADKRYTAYSYDAAGHLSASTRYAMALQGDLAVGQIKPDVVATDSAAQADRAYVVSKTSNYAEEGADQSTRYIYDRQGRLTALIDAEGYVTTYGYDASGRRTSEVRHANKSRNTVASGAITLGRVFGAETVYYVVADNLKDQVLRTTYDDVGRIETLISQPQGTITRYSYDETSGSGLLTQVTVAADTSEARTTWVQRDLLGRVIAELTPEGSKALLNAASHEVDAIVQRYVVRHFYNDSGYRVATLSPDGVGGSGNLTTFYYDKVGRLTHSINAMGEVVSYTYNTFGDVTEERHYATRLNPNGYEGGFKESALTSAVAALTNGSLDRITQWTYNRAGQLSTEIRGLQLSSLFTYNSFGEQVLAFEEVGVQGSGNYRQTAYGFDRLGRLTSTKLVDFNTAQVLNQTSLRYDAFGRVIERTDGRGVVSTLRYDRLGRVVVQVDPGQANGDAYWAYDAFGRTVAHMNSAGGITRYAYDDAARSMTMTTPENISMVTRMNRHGQTVEVQDGRGNVTRYQYNADGQLTQTSIHSMGAATAVQGTTSTRSYDAAGRLQLEVDVLGKQVRYTYDAAGRMLTREEDPDLASLMSAYLYDGVGNVIWSRNAAEVWTRSEYDDRGRLTAQVIDPPQVPDVALMGANHSGVNTVALVANTSSTPLNGRTEFTYTVDGLTQRVTRGAGSSQPEVTEYTYDVLGRRVAETLDPDGLSLRTEYLYDANGNVVMRKDALNHVTRYIYSASNQLTHTIDAIGAVTQTDYDQLGRASRVVAYAQPISATSLQALGDNASPEQTVALLPTSIGEQDQVSYRFYDKDGRLTLSLDALGYATERVYDAAGNLTRITRYFHKPTNVDTQGTPYEDRLSFGKPTLQADTPDELGAVRDQTDYYFYDAANRLGWHVDALGYTTRTTYTVGGRFIQTTRYANKASYSAGQSAPTVVADRQRDQTTRVFLDVWGRESIRWDAEGYRHDRLYDEVGRLQLEVHYSDEGALDIDHPSNVQTRYDYDAAGRLTKITDPEGAVTFKTYDAAGRLTESTRAYASNDASTTQYGYDAAGRVIQEVRAKGKPEQATTRYQLNALGQQEQVIDARGIEAAEGGSDWAKAERARLIGTEVAPAVGSAAYAKILKAYTTTQIFDVNGRLIQTIDPLGGSTKTEYDAFGNAVKVTDPSGNCGYFYFDDENRQIFQVDPNGGAVQTERDAFGNAVCITRFYEGISGEVQPGDRPQIYDAEPSEAPSGAYIVRSAGYYDSDFGVLFGGDAITVIEYDVLNRQVAIQDALDAVERMVYGDAFGNKTGVVNKLGGLTAFGYDRLNRMTSAIQSEKTKILNADGGVVLDANGQAELQQVETRYEYDWRGNRIAQIEAFGTALQRTTTYAYDKRGMLISTRSDAMSAYTVEKGAFTDTPVETRKYDLRGNLVEVQDASGARTLTWWDTLDRKSAELTATSALSDGQRAGSLVTYEYNSADMIIQRVWGQLVTLPVSWSSSEAIAAPGAEVRETHFAYDANHRLTDTVVTGAVVGEINGSSGNFVLDARDLVKSLEYDANGNVIVETDARGGQTFNYYDALGNRIASVDALRYASFWVYDTSGNLIFEVRTARQLPPSYEVTPDSDPQTLANLTASLLDRGTVYFRDRMGRVLMSTVLDTKVFNPFAQNESEIYLNAAAGSYPTTRYEYNGLGLVTAKLEISGELTEWVYDKQGREITKSGAWFVDFEGQTVRSITDTEYNAQGEIQRSIGRGKVVGTESDDRITTYRYGANGLLASVTDATGAVTRYQYDLAGHLTRTQVARLEGTDNFNRIANKDVGRLYLERTGVAGQDNETTYKKLFATASFTPGVTSFTADFSLGSNAVDRNFDLAFSGLESAAKAVQHGIQVRDNTVTASVTTGTGTAASAAATLRNDADYRMLVEISIDLNGNYISTLRLFDLANSQVAVLTDTRTLGSFAWTQQTGVVVNRAKPSSATSAGLGAADSVGSMSLTVPSAEQGAAQSNTTLVDQLDALALESNLTTKSGSRNMLIYDAYGVTSRSVLDVEEFAYDAAGREVRRHSYTSATGSHAAADVAANGTLVIDRKPMGSTGWADLNGSDAVAWGNGTAFYSEVHIGADGVGRNFVVGIQSGDSGTGVTVPGNLGRHAVNFTGNQFTFSYADNKVFANQANFGTLEANTTYVVEVRVEKNQLGETWSRLYVYKKGTSIETAWQDTRKVTTLWAKAQVLVANYSGSSTSAATDHVDRLKLEDAAGKSLIEDFTYRSRALGSLTPDQSATANSMWIQDGIGAAASTNSTTSELRYNAYGEVVAKGIEGGWQESAQFDHAGRAVRTMAEDGVPRLYVYDGNGNITLTLSPPADGVSSSAVESIFRGTSPITSGDIKTLLSQGARVLVSAYDLRGQLTDTFESSASKLFVSASSLNSTMGSIVAEEVITYPPASSVATGKGVSASFTYDSKFYSNWTGGGSGNDRTLRSVTDTFGIQLSAPGEVGFEYRVQLQVANGHYPKKGRGYVQGVEKWFIFEPNQTTGLLTAGDTFNRAPTSDYWSDYGDVSGAGISVKIYKFNKTTGNSEIVATMGGELPRTGLPPYTVFVGTTGSGRRTRAIRERHTDLTISARGGVDTPNGKSFTVSYLPQGTTRAVIQYRMFDQAPAAWRTASVNIQNGKVVFGEDVLRAMGSTAIGIAEKPMSYVLSAMDEAGRVLSMQSGQIGVYRDAGANNYYYGDITQPPETLEDRTGRVFTTAQGVNFVAATAAEGHDKKPAQSAVVRFRVVGSSQWSSAQIVAPATIGGVATPGWFTFNPPGTFTAGTTFEYLLELKDEANGQGNTLDALNGYIKASSGVTSAGAYQVYDGVPPVKADRSPTILRLQDVPSNATSVVVTYTLTKRVWTTQAGAALPEGRLVVEHQDSVILFKGADGKYQWDAAVVALDPDLQYTLDYTVTVKDRDNVELGTITSREALRRGTTTPQFDAVIYSPSAAATQLYRPSSPVVKLIHSTETAAVVRKVVLSYRLAGTTGAYKNLVATPPPDAQGFVYQVEFDLSTVPEWNAASAFTDFEVYYRYEDSAGAVILGATTPYGEDAGAPTRFTPVIVRAMAMPASGAGAADAATALWGFVNAPSTSHRQQVYNAFGEVAFEFTANNIERAQKKMQELGRALTSLELATYATWLNYDGMGRLVVKIDPETNVTLENGYQGRNSSATTYRYDYAGRLVGVRDARGNYTSYSLMPTGDDRRLVEMEMLPGTYGAYTGAYPDNVVKYDVFGDARYKLRPAGSGSSYVFYQYYYYDKLGRLIRVDMPTGGDGKRATHLYGYDSKGNRVQHRTSAIDAIDANGDLGANQITDYTLFDMMGRVRKTISGEGLVTTTDYGVAAGGQLTKVYTDENGKALKDWTDRAGRVLRHVDMGGLTFRYDYNLAGNLVGQYQVDVNNFQVANGQNITYGYWLDGTLKQVSDHALQAYSYYVYDKDGNRIQENYTVNNENLQTSTIQYDELGRIIGVSDNRYYELIYEYDQVGNRRRVYSQKMGEAEELTVDYWYTYDAQNRMLISMGKLLDGRATSVAAPSRITQGTTGRGVKLTYDAAGNRASALYAGESNAEVYSYSEDGYLTRTTKAGAQISLRTNDLLGRVTKYVQNNEDGVLTEDRLYDHDNRLTNSKSTNTKAGSPVIETWNYYQVIGGETKTGLLTTSKTVSKPTSGEATETYYRYDYIYRDSALQSEIRAGSSNPDVSASWGVWAQGVSQFEYDVNGHLKLVKDSQDGTGLNLRQVNFTVNADGLVLRRDEVGTSVMPFQRYFYVDGRRVVEWANEPIPNSVNYAEALMSPPDDSANPRERYRNVGPIRADVDQNYTPISASYPAFTPGGYTVRSGDTLQGIARAMWGDATMWYLIAEANGLMSDANLRIGQVLVIPNKVTNFHNTAQTARVYNPGEVMGDVSPTIPAAPVPPPPPRPDCGGVGIVLMVVVAVVATIVTAGAAAMALGAVAGANVGVMSAGAAALAGGSAMGATMGAGLAMAAAAIGGAVGSVAGQLTGMATGNVQKFSWSQVAMSAIGSGVGSGLGGYVGQVNVGGKAYEYVNAGLTAARNNVVTQGVSVVSGLQKKFDWRGVAAAAAGGAISQALSYDAASANAPQSNSWNEFGSRLAGGVLTRAASAVIYNQKPQWSTIALESFGSALGDAVVGSIQRADSQKTPTISENGDGAVARSELRYGKPDSTKFDLPNIDPNMPFGPSDDPVVNRNLAELDSNLNPSPTLDDDELLAAGPGYPGLGKRSATSVDVRGGPTTFGKFPSVGPEMTSFQKGFAKATLDMPFALYNAGVGTVEAGMNLLSGALPGFPDYVPVLDPIRASYLNPDVSEYTEFGFGLLGAGLARSRSGGVVTLDSTLKVESTVGKNTVTWTTGDDMVQASGSLKEVFGGKTRNSAETQAQAAAAAKGVAGDQGGHLVANRFMPNQGEKNLFPQNANFNNSAFKTLENDYARAINKGYEVKFEHTLQNFAGDRPGSVKVKYTVFDSQQNVVTSYKNTFNNQAGQKYTRRIN